VLRSGRRQLQRERERGGRERVAELEEVNTWKKEEQTFHIFWIYESLRGFSMQFWHVYLIMWISFCGGIIPKKSPYSHRGPIKLNQLRLKNLDWRVILRLSFCISGNPNTYLMGLIFLSLAY
jgi:hypothetical protein